MYALFMQTIFPAILLVLQGIPNTKREKGEVLEIQIMRTDKNIFLRIKNLRKRKAVSESNGKCKIY